MGPKEAAAVQAHYQDLLREIEDMPGIAALVQLTITQEVEIAEIYDPRTAEVLTYGSGVYQIFPQGAPPHHTTPAIVLEQFTPDLPPHEVRATVHQTPNDDYTITLRCTLPRQAPSSPKSGPETHVIETIGSVRQQDEALELAKTLVASQQTSQGESIPALLGLLPSGENE